MALMDESVIPISALQHWLYCQRQCALIHLEREWVENSYTAEGRVLHDAAHSGREDSRKSVRVTRSMPVSSTLIGLTGQCDVVELHYALENPGKKDPPTKIVPVEYKRGQPKAHRADEVQLCAQALCLEEMFCLQIEQGFLFYGRTQHRFAVPLDETLRCLTIRLSREIRSCLASGLTPLAKYTPEKCDRCSLVDICQPLASRFKRGAATWFKRRLECESDYA